MRGTIIHLTLQHIVDNVLLIVQDKRMPRKQDIAHSMQTDHVQAHREQDARERLMGLGANQLDARPWRPPPTPPSAVDLVQFAVWRSADLDPEGILSALALLPAARAEVEGLESGLLFTARSAGLTWAQMAQAMGFNSPQACQQHYTRLAGRSDADS
ncbi:DNA-binding protein [Nonomuraea sp. NPDC050680]|uniref:DNA-binding protein n=1 Tax=Nonomuraea sp. NPDC050680 TaxID=3154630 RepID=UPI0033EC8FCF